MLVPELVGDLEPPNMAGLKAAVEVLQDAAGGYGRFSPSRMLVRQILAVRVDLHFITVDVEVIKRHRLWQEKLGAAARAGLGLRKVTSGELVTRF